MGKGTDANGFGGSLQIDMIKKPSKLLYIGAAKLDTYEHRSQLQKGIAKINEGQSVSATRERKEQRMVAVTAKLSIMIDVDDPRTNEQIRKEWLEKREGELRKVAS